jgi:hypothetical protein
VGTATRRLVVTGALFSHRIEDGVAESATGDYAPLIESTDRLIACGRGPRRASHRRRTPNQGQKPAKNDGSPTFLGIEMHLWDAAHPAARAPRSGTVICVESNRPAGEIESISRDFDAARDATRRKLPTGVRSRVAHAVPIAEPPACHRDRRARKDAPKRAIWDIGRS